MANGNDKQDWIHNELKTGEPTYDGNYHSEHYQGCGVSIAVIVIIAGVLEMAGGGVGILIGLVMIAFGIFSRVKK